MRFDLCNNAVLVLNSHSLPNYLQGSTEALAQTKSDKYDLAALPVPPQKYLTSQLMLDLHAGSSSPSEMFQTIRRADGHGQTVAAFRILDAMRVKQPGNAVVQSGYCFVVNLLKGEYSPKRYEYYLTDEDYQHYATALKNAYIADPKLWLPHVVEGRDLTSIPGKESGTKGLDLLKKAVKLAPESSITHMMLGDADAFSGTEFNSYDKAVKEFQIAQKLRPLTSYPARNLIDIYAIRIPDKAKAIQAKKDYLSTLPPGYKISVYTLELLAYVEKMK